MTFATFLRPDPPPPVRVRDELGVLTVLDRVLTLEECAGLIDASESLGFDDAPINGISGPVMAPEVRNNTRVMTDDPELAAALWRRLAPLVPREPPGDERWRAVGLNERFRLYRYHPGQAFRWHGDGAYHRTLDEESHYSVLLYLNGEVQGGDTEFARLAPVVPAAGRAAVFLHRVRHQGAEVTGGVKYVLRTDLMFRIRRG